jgi:hypothetical protein
MSRPSSRTLRRAAVAGGVLAGLAVPSAAFAADPVSNAVVLSNDRLATFDAKSPATATTFVPVTGLVAGDKLVGIDVRPQNGFLYGLGVNTTADTIQLYALSSRTGVAKAIGDPIAGVDGADFGFDFNPMADRIRVVSDTGENLRLNPNTGALAATDTDISGTTPVDGSAYTNSAQNATATTLFSLSGANQKLYVQNTPNGGTQTVGQDVKAGGAAIGFTDVGGFDIAPDVSVAVSNELPTPGSTGLAAVNVAGASVLAKVDLNTGAATAVGPIGNGTQPVQGLAIQQEEKAGGLPAVSLTDTGKIRRFNTATPLALAETDAITGLGPGEVPVAIDWRPQTGQLLLLGVNHTDNEGTLYRVDPQATATTATATRIGLTGSVKFVDGGGDPIDLPNPATTGYDIDVNPTVDRVRVVTGSGLNFRLNPNAGDNDSPAVDGNGGGPQVQNGVNPDGLQKAANGDTTVGLDVAGTAYTNAFGQALPVAPSTTAIGTTTQYGISATKNALQIQTPPNSGTQTAPKTVTVGGAELDFTAVRGFDIPPAVAVATSNAPATGSGLALLTVGGFTRLYTVDLGTGAATQVGLAGGPPVSFTSGDGPTTIVPPVVTPPPGGGGGGVVPPGGGGVVVPPPGGGTVTPPAKAGFGSSTKITVKLRATRISRKGPAKITLRNTNKFAVKVRVQASTPKSGKRKAIKYATKTYTVKASSSRTVNIKLPAAARKVLASKKKLTIKVTLRATAPDGKSRTVRKTLTARLKK